jgi:hypothetical protein
MAKHPMRRANDPGDKWRFGEIAKIRALAPKPILGFINPQFKRADCHCCGSKQSQPKQNQQNKAVRIKCNRGLYLGLLAIGLHAVSLICDGSAANFSATIEKKGLSCHLPKVSFRLQAVKIGMRW